MQIFLEIQTLMTTEIDKDNGALFELPLLVIGDIVTHKLYFGFNPVHYTAVLHNIKNKDQS